MPREAALDSEFLALASQLGTEQCYRLNTGFRQYEIGEFITKLKTNLQASGNIEDDEGDEVHKHYDWNKLGNLASQFFATTPTATFMYGPLGVELGVQKQRKKRTKDAREALVTPEEVMDTEKGKKNETTIRVQKLKQFLKKAGKIDLWKLILDPNSFSHTVENVFHFSFLIKDGHAALTLDDKGLAMAELSQPPKQEDYLSGVADRKQCVLRFDYKLWQKLIEKYKIKEPFMPKEVPEEGNDIYSQLLPDQESQSQNHRTNKRTRDENSEKEPKQKKRKVTKKSKTNKTKQPDLVPNDKGDGDLILNNRRKRTSQNSVTK